MKERELLEKRADDLLLLLSVLNQRTSNEKKRLLQWAGDAKHAANTRASEEEAADVEANEKASAAEQAREKATAASTPLEAEPLKAAADQAELEARKARDAAHKAEAEARTLARKAEEAEKAAAAMSSAHPRCSLRELRILELAGRTFALEPIDRTEPLEFEVSAFGGSRPFSMNELAIHVAKRLHVDPEQDDPKSPIRVEVVREPLEARLVPVE